MASAVPPDSPPPDSGVYDADPDNYRTWYCREGYEYDGHECCAHPGFWLNVSQKGHERWRMPNGFVGCGVKDCHLQHGTPNAASQCETKSRASLQGQGKRARAPALSKSTFI